MESRPLGVVVACASCILADDHGMVRKVEVLRAIGDKLDCPMPPLLVSAVQGPEHQSSWNDRSAPWHASKAEAGL